MKKNKNKKRQIGISSLLNIGSGVALIGVIFIGAFSILNLYKIKGQTDKVNDIANDVSITVNEVAKSLDEIDDGSNKISEGMGNIKAELDKTDKKVKAINDDMQMLLVEPLGEIVTELDTLSNSFNSLVSNYESSIESIRKLQEIEGLNDNLVSENETEEENIIGGVKEVISDAEGVLDNFKANTMPTVAKFIENVTDSADIAGTMGDSVTEAFKDSVISISSVTDKAINDIKKAIEVSSNAGVMAGEIEGAAKSIKGSSASTTQEVAKVVWVMIIVAGIVTVAVLYMAFYTKAAMKPINNVIQGLTSGAEQLAAASNDISGSSQKMAESATEQAATLEETSSSLEQISESTKQNAENADKADKLSNDVHSSADRSKEAMERMVEVIGKIKTSSDETAKILKTIDEIAFQTNLLALNAAVEAARAGEAGKGFAVVAEEVRNLAQRSAEAAKNTAMLIEESQKNAENGVKTSSEVAEVLKEVIDGVTKITEIISGLSSASIEQAKSVEQVNVATNDMDKVTQTTATSAEHSAAASEELNAQANELNGIVNTLATIIRGGNGKKIKNNGDGHAKLLNYHVDRVNKKAVVPPKMDNEHVKETIPLDDEELKNF